MAAARLTGTAKIQTLATAYFVIIQLNNNNWVCKEWTVSKYECHTKDFSQENFACNRSGPEAAVIAVVVELHPAPDNDGQGKETPECDRVTIQLPSM